MDLVPSPVPAVVVLGLVLLVGLLAGRAKRRWALLVAGLVAVVVLGAAITLASSQQTEPSARFAALYQLVVPPGVAFVAGWLCGRGSWLRRIVVLAVAVLVLATFPYEAAGRATAEVWPTAGREPRVIDGGEPGAVVAAGPRPYVPGTTAAASVLPC